MAEVTLGQKEKENAALREQVLQYEARWMEYEAKMKSVEEMWQNQMTSLQISLAAAKKSLGTGNTTVQPVKTGDSQSPRFLDSEDMAVGAHSPGSNMPSRFLNNGLEASAGQDTNGCLNVVSLLAKEFEQRKQNFDDEASAIIGVKPGHSPSLNPIEEFRRLKHRFDAWRNDYKVRLREAKAKVHRAGLAEAEKHRRKWWGKKNKRL